MVVDKSVIGQLFNQIADIFFDAPIVRQYVDLADGSGRGYGLVAFFFLFDGCMVILYLAVKSFQVDLVGRVISDHADKFTGGQTCNF